MKIISNFKNLLLGRKEVELVFTEEINPGFEKSSKEIADHFKTNGEHVVVRSIKSGFGKKEFLVVACVYDNLEGKEKMEPKVKVKKGAVAS